jgi:ubiquinone/menaquinone biosynthesis C-methylase UbiE
MKPPEAVVAHYQHEVEERSRLLSGVGLLERTRTQEIVARNLPPAPARVLDIGGGAGVYAEWLAGLGYEVELLDARPKHVEQARRICPAHLGDARSLPFESSSAEAMLFLGPLYHLTKLGDRLAALHEARRVLRRGAPLFAAAISHFASLVDGLMRGLIDDPAFPPILHRDLECGQHRNPAGNPEYFTEAFFHRPSELRAEAEEAGFSNVEVYAVEGPVWVAPDFAARWEDPAKRNQLLDLPGASSASRRLWV